MAVNGACNTPAIIPAIPTRVKLLSETDILKKGILLRTFATKLPMILPIKREGAKIPPTPPAPNVNELAIILKKTRPASNIIMIQTLERSKCRKLFSSAFSGLPAIKLLITSKPSPYNGGIK